MNRRLAAAPSPHAPRVLPLLAGGAGLAALTYAGVAATTWARYGRPASPAMSGGPLRLDAYLPAYEAGERHRVLVEAPAEVTMSAARALDFGRLPVAQALFRTREWILGRAEEAPARPGGLLEGTLAMGWGVLADEPGRALVVGAVCRPWHTDPGFRAVPPERFAAFAEPDLVKIVWAVGVEAAGPGACVCHTETRVATTDAAARRRFRRYWAAFAPGIRLIRREMLRQVKAEAERAARGRVPAA